MVLRMALIPLALAIGVPLTAARVPVIYTSDLFHPHDDPDDHYDLATLFSLPELDVKAIVIDMSHSDGGKKPPGVAAIRQMMHLTGRTVPYATGLTRRLRSATDTGLDQPAETQGGVELILSTLRDSHEKVNLVAVGSLLDIAAAFNRQPELLRAKVKAIYVNAGNGPDGWQEEWNVRLDPHAYRRIMLSGLPIEWYPCFGREGFLTYYRVDQAQALSPAPAPLRAYFTYALTRSSSDPISFLAGEVAAPTGPRNMWSTLSLLDLAGRRLYRTEKGCEALPEAPGRPPVVIHRMRLVALAEVVDPATPAPPAHGPAPDFPCFHARLDVPEAPVRVLQRLEPDYGEVMASVLTNIVASFPARKEDALRQ